jgi:Double zinc ribbon
MTDAQSAGVVRMRLCTNCGFKNPDGSSFCIRCGSNLANQPPAVNCPSCGAPNIPKTVFCEACGRRISPETPYKAEPMGQGPLETLYPPLGAEVEEPKSSVGKMRDFGRPFWAGILLVIGGALDIANGISTFSREIPSNDLGLDLSGYIAFCATLTIILGVGAILGGILSWRKEYFYVVLVGTIMGMLGVGYYWSGFVLCFIAMLLVATSKDEYGP